MSKHTYSVGKSRIHFYCDTLAEAQCEHAALGLDGRTGIYRWDIGPPPEGKCGQSISNPIRMPLTGSKPSSSKTEENQP